MNKNLYKDKLRVINPREFPAELECERVPVGGRRTFKPNVTMLSSGELLMTSFHAHSETESDGFTTEHIMLYRSKDNGKTWSSRHYDHLHGREPYLCHFSGDHLIMTSVLLYQDVRNLNHEFTTNLHISKDKGETWDTVVIGPSMFPEKVEIIHSTRNIIELPDGTYIFGVCAGYGRDYLFTSKDRGYNWDIKKCSVNGYNAESYIYSVFQEGILKITESGRLLVFSRFEPSSMEFTQDIQGLPDSSKLTGEENDHYHCEIIFESRDGGITWEPVNAIPLMGCMYPSVETIGNDEYLFTYTQRINLEGMRKGVYAFLLHENTDDKFVADYTKDLIVIDEKTPEYLDSGGGFGNSLLVKGKDIVTPYSYYHANPEIEELLKSGKFMEKDTFNYYLDRMREYLYYWAAQIKWENVKEMDRETQTSIFCTITEVLNLSGPKTEVCRWKLP